VHLRMALACSFLATACANAGSAPPPPRPALQTLLAEQKFRPTAFYTGADTPEDEKPLQDAVDSAVRVVAALPEPMNGDAVRHRLAELVRDTDLFATEDRDEVYRYAVRAWRAAGLSGESGLFAMLDDRVLARP
jgi:hypothetical protein